MERPTGKFAYIITLKRERQSSMKMFRLTLFAKKGGSATSGGRIVDCHSQGIPPLWYNFLRSELHNQVADVRLG